MIKNLEFEKIDDLYFRAKVFGGWIVKSIFYIGYDIGVSMTFVPDPNHEWELDKDNG